MTHLSDKTKAMIYITEYELFNLTQLEMEEIANGSKENI